MALALNNFVGFETGGLEEADSVTGSPEVQSDIVRTGNYALKLTTGAYHYYYIDPFVTSDAGNKQMVCVWVYFSDLPSGVNSVFLYASDSGTRIWQLDCETDGDLRVTYADATTTTETGVFSGEGWYLVEVLWEQDEAGDFDVHVNGVSEISDVGKDLNISGTFDQYSLRDVNGSGIITYFDDFYCMSGASSVSDFLGPRVEVLGAFQNTAEDATDQGNTLDDGTWADTGDTPGVDEGTPAGYTGSEAETGYIICDEGVRDGPDLLITGTAEGAKWIHRLQRGSGSGTTHRKIIGKNTTTVNPQVTLSSAWGYFVGVSAVATYMPNVNTDSFAQGFEKETGGREIYCAEIWSFLLHVAPDPATLDLSDMEFPDQNYYLGPFGT